MSRLHICIQNYKFPIPDYNKTNSNAHESNGVYKITSHIDTASCSIKYIGYTNKIFTRLK